MQGVEKDVRKGTFINSFSYPYSLSHTDDKMVEESLYHQLLCYLQLLETNKPFLVNITRVPGKHLSFPRSIPCINLMY